MKSIVRSTQIIILFILGLSFVAKGQNTHHVRLTLDEVITLAQEQSIDAMLARHSFLGSYWEYRSYLARFMPSFSLSGSLPSFDRSLLALQNPDNGEFKYVQNYVMRNNLGVNVKQNIGLTGGSVSLFTGLERLDQFVPDRRTTYNSSPISLILNQPIGAFNSLKWEKKIEPVKYERAKFIYLEGLENIKNYAVDLFFTQLIVQQNLNMAKQNHANTDTLYQISKRRLEIGAITQSDLLQLELRLLNEGISINENQLQLQLAQARLRSYLGYNETVDITLQLPGSVPATNIDIDLAYTMSTENTSFSYQQRVLELDAEKAVAQAKANRRPQISIYARFGLNQVGNNFGAAYRSPLDQENVSVGINIPIFDGGVAKGRVKMSLSQQDVVDATLEKESIDRKQDIFLKVMQFNNQAMQCNISQRADDVANQRYSIAMTQFAAGRMSVLELNTAQTERNSAHNRLIQELYNHWSYYYSIQRLTLFDFRKNENISTEFDKLIK